MSRELAKPPPPSRYSYKRATVEVEREISSRNEIGLQKQVAAYCNLTETQFSHRMRGVYAKFQLEHFGAIADALKMPAGCPFLVLAPKAKK